MRSGLEERFADDPVRIISNGQLRSGVLDIFDQTFAVVRLLQLMSLLIAACGITLTLLILARERVSELALYRALGAERTQVFLVFLAKGAGIAAVSSILGVVGGTALALILVLLINRAYFGWTIQLSVPWIDLAASLLLIFAAALLASIYPSASRQSNTGDGTQSGGPVRPLSVRSSTGTLQVREWNIVRFLLVLLLAGGGLLPVLGAVSAWRVPDDAFPWKFPEDHWAHRDFRIEWWYFTGHLLESKSTNPRFGYQFTIFRIGLSPTVAAQDSDWSSGQLLMGHAAVSDLERKKHRFAELVYREHPALAGFGESLRNPVAWSIGPPGTAGRWELSWTEDGFSFSSEAGKDFGFSLETRPATGPVLEGPGGLSQKSTEPGAASLYYSFPRLETSGTVRLGDEEFTVTGESWMDKEFSSAFLSKQQSGWDWFSLRMEDGRSLMLYQLRRESGAVDFRGGTLIGTGGEVHYLGTGAWEAEIESWWTSPETGGRYPVAWRVRLPEQALDLRVESDFAQQENVSKMIPSLAYWEGSVRVSEAGRLVGRGYLEMTGYVPGGRLPVRLGQE